jgi:hypothetical protein
VKVSQWAVLFDADAMCGSASRIETMLIFVSALIIRRMIKIKADLFDYDDDWDC